MLRGEELQYVANYIKKLNPGLKSLHLELGRFSSIFCPSLDLEANPNDYIVLKDTFPQLRSLYLAESLAYSTYFTDAFMETLPEALVELSVLTGSPANHIIPRIFSDLSLVPRSVELLDNGAAVVRPVLPTRDLLLLPPNLTILSGFQLPESDIVLPPTLTDVSRCIWPFNINTIFPSNLTRLTAFKVSLDAVPEQVRTTWGSILPISLTELETIDATLDNTSLKSLPRNLIKLHVSSINVDNIEASDWPPDLRSLGHQSAIGLLTEDFLASLPRTLECYAILQSEYLEHFLDLPLSLTDLKVSGVGKDFDLACYDFPLMKHLEILFWDNYDDTVLFPVPSNLSLNLRSLDITTNGFISIDLIDNLPPYLEHFIARGNSTEYTPSISLNTGSMQWMPRKLTTFMPVQQLVFSQLASPCTIPTSERYHLPIFINKLSIRVDGFGKQHVKILPRSLFVPLAISIQNPDLYEPAPSDHPNWPAAFSKVEVHPDRIECWKEKTRN